jgi:ferredoxin/flavodoxin---NADP+ reductase
MPNDPTNASIIDRHDLNETLSIVRVRPDNGRIPEFKPGQFVTLGLPKPMTAELAAAVTRRPGLVPMVRRAYSVASAPHETEALELFVVLVETGKLTPHLWKRDFPNRVWLEDVAKGEFTLDCVPPGRDLVMISTGTGIAPFVSMLRTFRGQNRWRRLVIVNGVRQVSDLGYRTELEAISRAAPTVRYVPIVSRPGESSTWDRLRGHVQLLLDDTLCREHAGLCLDPQHCNVFLCGNPAMTDEMEVTLQGRGFRTHTTESAGNIHLERYW